MTSWSVIIRPELPQDEGAVHTLLVAAFPSNAEARLVDALRQAGRLRHPLVAMVDEQLVGFITFSPVTVGETRPSESSGLGLAPLAVAPAWQREGIGGRLIRAGLEACQAAGAGFVVVLGEPSLYSRHGFRPAADRRLADTYGGGPAFQALELYRGGIPHFGGTVHYAPEFKVLEGL